MYYDKVNETETMIYNQWHPNKYTNIFKQV